jgi:hypothetical protein
VFGAGASVLTGPSAASPEAPQPPQAAQPAAGSGASGASGTREAPYTQALRAQGLWTNPIKNPSSPPVAQPKIVSLPRAVLGSSPDSTPPAAAPPARISEPAAAQASAGPQPARAATESVPLAAARAASPEPPKRPSAPTDVETAAATIRLESEPALPTPARTLTGARSLEPANTQEPARSPELKPETAPSAEPKPEIARSLELELELEPAPKPEPVAARKSAEPIEDDASLAGEVIDTRPPSQRTQPRKSIASASKQAKPELAQAPASNMRTAVIVAACIAAALLALFAGAMAGLWRLPWAPEPPPPAALAEPETARAAPPPPAAAPGAHEPPAAAAANAAPPPTAANVPPDDAREAESELEAAERAESSGNPEHGTTPEAFNKQVHDARELLKSRKPGAAEALMRPWLERLPNDHRSAEILTMALIEQGKGADAVPFAEQIVHKRPKRAMYRVLLGDALALTGDQAGAVAAWREALTLEPGSRRARLRLRRANDGTKVEPAAEPAQP